MKRKQHRVELSQKEKSEHMAKRREKEDYDFMLAR